MTSKTNGTLNDGEFHPAAMHAYRWLIKMPPEELAKRLEAFSSAAIEGNRMAEVCAETLNRVLTKQPVSDRYVLGLCWAMTYKENPHG